MLDQLGLKVVVQEQAELILVVAVVLPMLTPVILVQADQV